MRSRRRSARSRGETASVVMVASSELLVAPEWHCPASPSTPASDGRTVAEGMRPHALRTEEGVAMATYKVGYFVGSLYSKSINRPLSKALIRLAPEDLEFTEIPIRDLPLYSPDFDESYPPEAVALKEAIAAADAVLFITPEYNRSI